MKKYIFVFLVGAFLQSCMPEEDLPIRNVGNTPEYFIECYCTPGKIFCLSATSVIPVSENLEIDFSKEMSVRIHAGQEVVLEHVLFNLPGSDFIYNYGAKEKLHIAGIDSLYLDIITVDGQNIHASTPIPAPVDIYSCELVGDEAILRFYTSEKNTDNYYIYTVESISNDTVVHKEFCFLDYSQYPFQQGLTEKTLILPEVEKTEKVIFTLKRITQANYDYQISLNAANTANQSSLTTPVPLKGNLQGALGIFTCYTEDQQSIRLNRISSP